MKGFPWLSVLYLKVKNRNLYKISEKCGILATVNSEDLYVNVKIGSIQELIHAFETKSTVDVHRGNADQIEDNCVPARRLQAQVARL